MNKLKFHIFICTNERALADPRGCCKTKGSEDLIELFKIELRKMGYPENIRVQRAGCLDTCGWGPSVVVYPDAIWYQVKNISDVQEIIQSHLIDGKPVKRLEIPKK